MIISLFFYIYQFKQIKNIFNKEKKNTQESNIIESQNLIFNKNNQKDITISIKYLLLFFILWIFEEQNISFFMDILKDLDFWMIEILIITYFNYKIFKVQVYKHQLFVIIYNLFPIFFKIITIYLSFIDKYNYNEYKYKYNDKENGRSLKILYVVHKLLTPFGIIIYLFFITLRSFVNTKIKWYMDLKYFSVFKLLIFYGFIGTIINLIICIISTFIKCKDIGDKDVYDYICKVKKLNGTEIYYENFFIYFSSNSYSYFNSGSTYIEYDKYVIIFEILTVILDVITFFFHKYFTILIIKHLTPVYVIFSFPIHYFFKKTISLFYDLIVIKRPFILDSIDYIYPKYCLDLSGDIFSIFGFLVYLEIIELKCCGLNHDYRKNIIKRGFNECLEMQIGTFFNNEEDEKDDDE